MTAGSAEEPQRATARFMLPATRVQHRGSWLTAVALSALTALSACTTDNTDPPVSQVSTPVDPATTSPPPPPPPVRLNAEGYTSSVSAFPSCYNPDTVSGETVALHACSWTFNALKVQNLITQRQPFVQSPFIATHNSANSSAYPGVASSGDPNHSLTIVDQLGLGMSGLELDVHWIFHAASQRFAPVLCHGVGASQGHLGCTAQDRLLEDGLREIRAFLDKPESAGTVLLIDIENALQEFTPPSGATTSISGHDEAATLMKTILGDKLFLPPTAGSCNRIDPVTFTRQQVLAAGKQVVIVGGCGAGTVWPTVVFDMPRKQKANDGFDAATCEREFFSATDYSSTFTRIWHDSTRLSAAVIPGLVAIDASQLLGMVKCGLHQPSLDQLGLRDARLPVVIWSWDIAHPKPATTAQCTVMATTGRWRNQSCTQVLPYACRTATGWTITAGKGLWDYGRDRCAAIGARFDLPRSPADNLLLDDARLAAKADSVWMNWSDATGGGVFKVPPPSAL